MTRITFPRPEPAAELPNPAAFAASLQFFEQVIDDWLKVDAITLACGSWRDGAIMELVPGGQATLLPARYDDCFLGVRELRLAGAAHHLHIDLGRLHSVEYQMAPSVCLGYRTAFEVAFVALGSGGGRGAAVPLRLMLSDPYAPDRTLRTEPVSHWLSLYLAHRSIAPERIRLVADPAVEGDPAAKQILNLLRQHAGAPGGSWERVIQSLNPSERRALSATGGEATS